MKIYYENKTQELIDPDLTKGYIYEDKILVKHHEAIPEKVIKTVEEQVREYRAQGKEVIQGDDGNYYLTIAYWEETGGREGKPIEPIIESAQEAYDEFEGIHVYHPYSEDEYIEYLRMERERVCFPVINRGAAWYRTLTAEQEEELQAWYLAWLDVTKTKTMPQTPAWI